MKKLIWLLTVMSVFTICCLFNNGFAQELEPGEILPEISQEEKLERLTGNLHAMTFAFIDHTARNEIEIDEIGREAGKLFTRGWPEGFTPESNRISQTSSRSVNSPNNDPVTLFEGIYREGRFVVRQTWSGDFDKGHEAPRDADPGEADVWFQARTEIDRVIVPRNNAELSLMMQFIEPSLSQVQQVLNDGGDEEINVNHLLPGLWVAVKTNEGAYAAFTLEEEVSESPGVLHILYRYWAETKTEIDEDCLSFNHQNLEVRADDNRFLVTDGRSRMMMFDTREGAEQAVRIMRHYRLDNQCFAIRPNAALRYFKTGGDIPSGSFGGEDCNRISNPQNLIIRETSSDLYQILDGNSIPYAARSREEAERVIEIVQHYNAGFTCYVERPDPGMVYLRR